MGRQNVITYSERVVHGQKKSSNQSTTGYTRHSGAHTGHQARTRMPIDAPLYAQYLSGCLLIVYLVNMWSVETSNKRKGHMLIAAIYTYESIRQTAVCGRQKIPNTALLTISINSFKYRYSYQNSTQRVQSSAVRKVSPFGRARRGLRDEEKRNHDHNINISTALCVRNSISPYTYSYVPNIIYEII